MTYDIIREIMADVERNNREAIRAAAKANPVAYKDCKVFEGKPNYRYYERRDVHKDHIVRFCWTLNKNVAGYYLSFIEVLHGDAGARTKYIGYSNKRDAIADCRARYYDCEKAKADRKYTVPTYQELWDKRGGKR